MGAYEDLLAKARAKYGVEGAGSPGNVYTNPMDAASQPMTPERAAAEAQANTGKYGPGDLEAANQVNAENDDPSIVDTTIVATPAEARGVPRAVQVEDRLLERAAPGAQGRIHLGAAQQAQSAEGVGEATERTEADLANWYDNNRKEQNKLLSGSMRDYAERRQKIDELMPRLQEAADRIKNIKSGEGSFWGDFKDSLAYQATVAMHLVSDDHLGVHRATQDLVDKQLNKERFKLEQAKSSYEALQSTLGQFRALAGDAQIGDQLYRKSALEVAAMDLEKIGHTFKSQTAKDGVLAIKGKINEDIGKIDASLGIQTFRQASKQDADLAAYNNNKAAEQQKAELARVGQALLKYSGGDPEKAAKLGADMTIPPERVKAALAIAAGGPAEKIIAAPGMPAPATGQPVKAAAGKAAAGKVSADKGAEADPYGSYGAALASPDFWKKTKASPERVYAEARADLLSRGDTGTVARMAYAKAQSKLESEGNGKRYADLVGAISKGLADAETDPKVSPIRSAYTTARALRSEYDTLNIMFEKAAKTTGIPKEDIAAAYMKGGRAGVVESLTNMVSPSKFKQGELATRLKEAGLLNERAIGPRVLVNMSNRVALANATDTFGVLREGDMKFTPDIGSQLNPTWTELGTQLATTNSDVRQKAVSGTVGLAVKELKDRVLQNALTRQQLQDIMEDKMRGSTGNTKAGIQRAMVK